MKKIFSLVLSLVLLTSCVDSLDDWNIDQKRSSKVPAGTLFTGALKNMTDILTTPNVNSNNYRMFVQYIATTTYLDEPRYSMTSRNYSLNFWNAVYRDVISDLKEAKQIVQNDASIIADVKNNQLALLEIMEVYSWSTLVNTFGDIPYSEAFNPNNSLPKYDDAQTVYSNLLTRLDNALGLLTPAANSFGSADLLYAGNVSKWVKFGNSLKLRMAMQIADVDAPKAKILVEEASVNVISSSSENARFPYISSPPNNNPISANLNPLYSSREDFVIASTIVDVMNNLNDPRRQHYFTQVGGAYVGGNYGFSNAYGSYSHVSDKIIQPAFEALLLDYSEVEFLLAEALERGFVVVGSADVHYTNAIKASIRYWGGSDAEADAYVLQPEVAYATATGNYKQKIGTQKWIALNNRGWDAWVEWRRLDYPVLLPPSGPSIPTPLSIPVRMIYPPNEQTVNGAQWKLAAAKYNNDSPNSKLFWDVN
jgi:hypothetical protein